MDVQSSARTVAENWRAALVSGVVALVGTVVVALFSPGIDSLLAAQTDAVLFGVLLVLSSGVRVVAGVFGARSQRRRFGLADRTEGMAPAVVGVVLAGLLYALLIALAGGGVPQWRAVLEVVRWGVEAALGVYAVTPGGALDDATLRRLDRRAGLGGVGRR